MKDRFIAFLSKHRVYFRFRSLAVSDLFISIHPERWLIDAFNWDSTGEGHEFWETINTKWQKEIKNEKIS